MIWRGTVRSLTEIGRVWVDVPALGGPQIMTTFLDVTVGQTVVVADLSNGTRRDLAVIVADTSTPPDLTPETTTA